MPNGASRKKRTSATTPTVQSNAGNSYTPATIPRKWLLDLCNDAHACGIVFFGALRASNHEQQTAIDRFSSLYKQMQEKLRQYLRHGSGLHVSSLADPLVADVDQAFRDIASSFEAVGRQVIKKRKVSNTDPTDDAVLAGLVSDLYQAGKSLQAAVEAVPVAPLLEAIEHNPAPDVAAGNPGHDNKPVRHSKDFRSVHWYGKDYTFTQTQAACVRVLMEAWEKGTPEVSQLTILEEAGSSMADNQNPRLRDLFRVGKKTHPAWGRMIVVGSKKGTFRLDGRLP